MGYKTTTTLSGYERGTKTPKLTNLLKLEIIYRTPGQESIIFDSDLQKRTGIDSTSDSAHAESVLQPTAALFIYFLSCRVVIR